MASTEERLARVEEQVQEQSRGFPELRESVRHLEQRFDARFGALEQRFDGLERRFEGLERRFEGLEQRIDVRFTGFEQRFQYMEQRFDKRFDTLDRRQMTTLFAIISGFIAVVGALLTR